MAAVNVLKSSKAALKLNGGTTDAGKAITKSVTLPALIANPDYNDIIAISNAAQPCLAYSVVQIEHSVTRIITNE